MQLMCLCHLSLFNLLHVVHLHKKEYLVSFPSSGLEKTTRSSSHHVAQHRPTGSETTSPYAPQSSRFGSEPPCVADDVDVWHYAILHARNDDEGIVYMH